MDVLTALRNSDRPLADDELAELLGRDQRVIGQECRRLAFRGLIIREQHPRGVTVNKIYSGDL
jgi:predicted transcriptional regulator